MVNLTNLEAEIKEAEKKKEEELVEAQIEVYEGQNFEAKERLEEAKQKRAQARSRLPEEIPDDPEYKERLLQAQYIEARVVSPKQVEQIREYREEIKKQQKAKETVQVLDKEIPQLYTKAVEESKEVEKPKGSIDDSEVDIKHVEKVDDDSEYTKFPERDSSIDDDKKDL